MNKVIQMSESVLIGIILAFSGGIMDAYSFILRDHVFANAQTGNMILFGIHLAEREYQTAISYCIPLVSFLVGIALTEFVRVKASHRIHWRQLTVLVEVFIFIGVSFIPLSMNREANALVSLACGIQVESFRKVKGNAIATTMCIGNMRSGMQNFCIYVQAKNKQALRKAGLYFGILTSFVLGAVFGNEMIKVFREKAILSCSIFLFIAFMIMFIDLEKKAHR